MTMVMTLNKTVDVERVCLFLVGAVHQVIYQVVYNIFSWLSQRNTRMTYLTMVGLGLGFGFSITVFSQPGMTGAQGVFDQPYQEVVASRLALGTVDGRQAVSSALKPGLVSLWKSHDVIHTVGSAGLGESGTVVVAVGGLNPIRTAVTDLSLGNEVTLIGTNQGRYRYTIVELRGIPLADLASATSHQQPTLVLYTPSSLTGTDVIVAIGR